MSDKKYLGELEQLVLMAILKLNNQGYGVAIRQFLLEQIQRDVSVGALYTVLNRLEEKQMLQSFMGGASAERGGRSKKYYQVTAMGQRSLKSSLAMIDTLKRGLVLKTASSVGGVYAVK